MELDAVQAAASAKLLPFLLFCAGTVALFFVYRRNVNKAKTRDRSNDECLRARSFEAHRTIDQISAREWLNQHRRALKVSRDQASPQPQVRQALQGISNYQQRRVDG